MTTTIKSEQLLLYKSVFGGREDVFALRWEKKDKSGICQRTLSIRICTNYTG